MVNAEWTGSFPSLCSGVWKLWVDGVNVSDKFPENLRNDEMNTYGTYYTWSFGNNWDEEWDMYEDGLEQDSWIKENNYWLSTITKDYEVKIQIFEAIQMHDWRRNSCGGCI